MVGRCYGATVYSDTEAKPRRLSMHFGPLLFRLNVSTSPPSSFALARAWEPRPQGVKEPVSRLGPSLWKGASHTIPATPTFGFRIGLAQAQEVRTPQLLQQSSLSDFAVLYIKPQRQAARPIQDSIVILHLNSKALSGE